MVKLRIPFVSVVSLLALIDLTNAAEVVKGDLSRLSIVIGNEGEMPIECRAEIAHWFALPLGIVAPKHDSELDLWADAKTGTIATRNEKDEFLPVERVWCGAEGRAYETRWLVPLERRLETVPVPRRLSCRAGADRVECL